MVERGKAGRAVQNKELGMGERGKDNKKDEEGHKTTKVRSRQEDWQGEKCLLWKMQEV